MNTDLNQVEIKPSSQVNETNLGGSVSKIKSKSKRRKSLHCRNLNFKASDMKEDLLKLTEVSGDFNMVTFLK